ncbi:hypothetical protein D9613_012687 [Agrocybe pediades]|uniref:Uncharacterized protein n=1 Tax=Agrocybe pediades TaxID=84607 RepID=A0A8H4QWF0_9AGAR|nr:hypothetical protein D9613_012687 [Agrocybe pediades]
MYRQFTKHHERTIEALSAEEFLRLKSDVLKIPEDIVNHDYFSIENCHVWLNVMGSLQAYVDREESRKELEELRAEIRSRMEDVERSKIAHNAAGISSGSKRPRGSDLASVMRQRRSLVIDPDIIDISDEEAVSSAVGRAGKGKHVAVVPEVIDLTDTL